jgi:hypothetical protein
MEPLWRRDANGVEVLALPGHTEIDRFRAPRGGAIG